MKAFLMYRDCDFDLQQKLPWNEQALTQDLELDALFNAMACGDKFLFEVAKKATLSSLTDPDTILYRQNILKDCLKNPSIVREIYDIAIESIEGEKKERWWLSSRSPGTLLSGSVRVLQLFVGTLRKLRNISDEYADRFESEGLRRFFAMLKQELGDEYFTSIQDHLRELEFHNGVLISAELGKGNKGTSYVLRRQQHKKQSWLNRIFAKNPPQYTYTLADRDIQGAEALSELRERGINLVANATAQSTDHILSFFSLLRTELAFYVGCLNLHEQLTKKGAPKCFPVPVARGKRTHSFEGLYDVCLALRLEQRIVGNDANADNKDLVIVTGANRGGKSTFLRSIGLAQLMMQCGAFVPAESFCSDVCDGLFTHFNREEDPTMKSGKLDEELGRMSDIVDHLTPNCMVLFNESFAATNEREGSEIAGQIVGAILERRIKVFFVTHMYEFARGFYEKKTVNALFLRAERKPDGERTFKMIEGEPLQTSYGEDLYNRIFLGKALSAAPAAPSHISNPGGASV